MWKMFATIFTIAFAITHVSAVEMPSYIHVCGLRNPNLDECISNSVMNLKDKLCEGMSELDVKPLEPLIIDKIMIPYVTNVNISLQNAHLRGICDFKINSLHFDMDKHHFTVDLTIRQIKINTTYDANIHVLVSIIAKGQLFISTDNVSAKMNIDFKVVNKGGKRYMYISKLNLNLDIKGYNIENVENLSSSNLELKEILRHFLGSSQKEIIEMIKPYIEEVITKRLLEISNDIVKHFTYDDLFPDRT